MNLFHRAGIALGEQRLVGCIQRGDAARHVHGERHQPAALGGSGTNGNSAAVIGKREPLEALFAVRNLPHGAIAVGRINVGGAVVVGQKIH